jgi:hypothetical protein
MDFGPRRGKSQQDLIGSPSKYAERRSSADSFLFLLAHPSSAWVCQQLREAFPYDPATKYLIFDRAANFSEVVSTIESFGIEPKRTSFRSPWQNGVAERFVGNCRRDLLDHVIVINEQHLKRLMGEYVRYYHRTSGWRSRPRQGARPFELRAQVAG